MVERIQVSDLDPSSSYAPSFRALLIGALGSVAIGTGVPYGNMVLHGSRLGSDFNTPAAIILFFFLVFFFNTLVGLIRRSWMLRRAELALIYIMWIVATSIPEWGLTPFLLPDITSVIYYATPENNWDELLMPFIPDWIIPHREFSQIKNLYEGAPEGQGVPWALWLQPLAYWIPFVLALYLAMTSIMVILRKQWVERERLIFPMVQVPIAMLRDDEARPSLIKPFFKSGVMWLGFAIPFILQSLNGLNHYYPFFPHISVRPFSFQLIGFAYFINREIAFSVCFFHLITLLQQSIFDRLGLQNFDPVYGPYSAGGFIQRHLGFGGIVVLVLFGLWTGRGHLREVFRKAFRGASAVDDSGEILSYRAAVFVLLGSLTFMGVWLWRSGLPAWITPIYLFCVFTLFIGITRVVAQGGLVVVFAPLVASDFVAAGFGTRALGPTGIIAFAFTYVWGSDILIFVMSACANGLKLAEETIKKRRHLIFWGILVAILVTLFSSIWAILELAYRYGGLNTDEFFFVWAARYPFDNAASRIQSLGGPHWANWGYTALGAIIMGVLTVARQRFLWWPLHPLGFPIGFHFVGLYSVLLAWLIKTVVLKYGGPTLYLKTRPFFLGLILGQYVPAGVWYVIDYFTGTSGNEISPWP